MTTISNRKAIHTRQRNFGAEGIFLPPPVTIDAAPITFAICFVSSSSIRFRGRANEAGQFAVEARGILVERGMADPVIDREFGAGDDRGGVLRDGELGVAIL